MAAINYEALRSLISGHVVNTNYDIDVVLELADRSVKPKSKVHVSVGGQQETVIQRIDKFHQMTIGSITNENIDLIREFADSVQGGEVFVLDVMGSVAVPNNPMTVIASPGYTESRVNGSNLWRISMKVREV